MTNEETNTSGSPGLEVRQVSGDPKIQLSSETGIPALHLTFTATGWTASGGRYDDDTDTYSVSTQSTSEDGVYFAPVYYKDETVGDHHHYGMVYWEQDMGGFPVRLFQSATEITSPTADNQSNIYGAHGDVYSLNLWLQPVRSYQVQTQNNPGQCIVSPYWLPNRYTNLLTSTNPVTTQQQPYTEFGLISTGTACLLFQRKLSGVIYVPNGKDASQSMLVGYPTREDFSDASSAPCQTWAFDQQQDATLTLTSDVGLVWAVPNGSKNEGIIIETYTRKHTNSFKWTFVEVAGGS
ncbi:MAG: hypothetical protein AAF799_33280 [Myxococcota bacterium]